MRVILKHEDLDSKQDMRTMAGKVNGGGVANGQKRKAGVHENRRSIKREGLRSHQI